jgi:hypothetical protein
MGSINQFGDPDFTGVADRQRGGTDHQQFRLQNYVLWQDLTGVTPAGEGSEEIDAAEAHTAQLRATRLRATPGAAAVGRGGTHARPGSAVTLTGRFLGRDNQAFLTGALLGAARGVPGMTPDRVRQLVPGWVKNYAAHHLRPGMAPESGESLPAQLAAINRAFVDDRRKFMHSHNYLTREQAPDDDREDDPARYQAGEFSSIYWDMNRALSDPSHSGAHGRAAAGGPGSGPVHDLVARDTRMPPIQRAERPVFVNPSRYSRGASATTPQRNATAAAGMQADRDRTLELAQAFQERSDRRPTVIRGRTLRASVRDDRSALAGPPELAANPAIGAHFGRGIADRVAASARRSREARDIRRIYMAPSAYRRGGDVPPRVGIPAASRAG